jgi:hypothetical protein
MNPDKQPNPARRVIRSLRAGVASPASARAITVGTEAIEAKMVQYTSSLMNGNAKPRLVFVLGDWGFGKSHIRMLCVEELRKRGIPHVHDAIDGSAGSLSHIHRCVPRWLEGLRIGQFIGLRAAFDGHSIDRDKAYRWALANFSRFSTGLRLALAYGYWHWANGHQFRSPDYSYQHPHGLEFLLSAAGFVNGMGRGGIALLLDEAENISRQYDIRGRRKTYDTLARLVQSPYLFCVVFITKRFFQQVEEDIARGRRDMWAGWTGEARDFIVRVQQQVPVEPPPLTRRLAKALIEKITLIYQEAYGKRPIRSPGDEVLRAWEVTATRSIRLLVRLTVHHLDIAYGDPTWGNSVSLPTS